MTIIRIFSKSQGIIKFNIRSISTTISTGHNSTVDNDDVRRHSYLAADWWDPVGPMKALHSLNKIRYYLN